MTDSTVAERVRTIIAASYNEPCVLDSAKMPDDAAWDTLGISDLANDIEDAFQITVGDSDALAWHTVGDVVRYVEAKVGR